MEFSLMTHQIRRISAIELIKLLDGTLHQHLPNLLYTGSWLTPSQVIGVLMDTLESKQWTQLSKVIMHSIHKIEKSFSSAFRINQ